MKKKLIASVLLTIVLLTALAACAKKVKYDICGETKPGTTRQILGEKVSICNDCIKDYSF